MTAGWTCPACNKGNAPWAAKCGHCADPLNLSYPRPPNPPLREPTTSEPVTTWPAPDTGTFAISCEEMRRLADDGLLSTT